MIDLLRDFISLQEVDSRIHELESQAEAIPEPYRELKLQRDQITDKIEQLRTELVEFESKQSDKDSSLQEEREKVKKWEKRLVDIQTPREAMAMQREVETQKRINKELEEQALQIMEEIDKVKTELGELLEQRTALEADMAEMKAGLDEKVAEISSRIAEEKKARAKIVPGIDKRVLARYDQIRSRRQGLAVARIVEHRCSGCNMNVPPQQYNDILAGKSLEVCQSCQRILYIAEEDTPA